MKSLKRLEFVAAAIICCLIQVQGIDDYTDSKRPYEFGFTIDGQQHRHEKKDKNGIIMGEFGFITADDVYHVTVYATDENGRFRILSMKNIHLKHTPEYRQGHSLQLPPITPPLTRSKPTPPQPLQASSPVQFTQKPQDNFKSVSIAQPVNSCSHCSLPTTSTPAPIPAVVPNSQPNINSYNSNPSVFSSPSFGNVQKSQSTNPFLNNQSYNNSPKLYNYPQSGLPNSQGQGLSNSKHQSTLSGPSKVGPTSFSSPSIQQRGSFGSYNGQTNDVNSQNYPRQQLPGVSPTNNLLPSYNVGDQKGIRYPNQNASPTQAAPTAGNYPSSYSQPSLQVPGTDVPFNKIFPYNSQNINRPNYPTQIANTAKGNQGAQKYPTSSITPQGELSPSGPRTAKQFSAAKDQPSGFTQNYSQGGFNGFAGSQGENPKKPTLVSAQIQIVDKNTDINYKRPGEKTGLPEGLTENDMIQLLYTFNYTLGFQAHYEKGYTNGFKQGYYYVTGRNGVRTRIDYTADDTGFHPKISQDVLDLLSDDVPKPETEKDAKYGLRGYEFKWLYYPVEHKSR